MQADQRLNLLLTDLKRHIVWGILLYSVQQHDTRCQQLLLQPCMLEALEHPLQQAHHGMQQGLLFLHVSHRPLKAA